MHPVQSRLQTEALQLSSKIAAKKPAAEAKAPPPSTVLWKYVDPDGKEFYLTEKKTTVKSPFTGKSFSCKPVRHTPAQVGKDLKDEAKAAK